MLQSEHSSCISVIEWTDLSAFAVTCRLYSWKKAPKYLIWKPTMRDPSLSIHPPPHPPKKKQMKSESSWVPWIASKSLLLSTHIPIRYLQAHAAICTSACLQARYVLDFQDVEALSLLLSLCTPPSSPKHSASTKMVLSSLIILGDVIFPLLTQKPSAQPDVLHKIQAVCFLSDLQVSFFWETSKRNLIVPWCSVWLYYAKQSPCILCSTMW